MVHKCDGVLKRGKSQKAMCTFDEAHPGSRSLHKSCCEIALTALSTSCTTSHALKHHIALDCVAFVRTSCANQPNGGCARNLISAGANGAHERLWCGGKPAYTPRLHFRWVYRAVVHRWRQCGGSSSVFRTVARHHQGQLQPVRQRLSRSIQSKLTHCVIQVYSLMGVCSQACASLHSCSEGMRMRRLNDEKLFWRASLARKATMRRFHLRRN